MRWANLETNLCGQVWDIGQNYLERINAKPAKENQFRRSNSHPVHLTKYMYFLYLTGSKLSAPLQDTWIEPNEASQGPYYRINVRKRVLFMPVFCVYEAYMLSYITDGLTHYRSEDMFRFDEWTSLKDSQLSMLLTRNFRGSFLTGKVVKQAPEKARAGLNQRMLTILRQYNLGMQHHVPSDLTDIWRGLKPKPKAAMLEEAEKARTQLDMLKEWGLITKLRPVSALE